MDEKHIKQKALNENWARYLKEREKMSAEGNLKWTLAAEGREVSLKHAAFFL